MATYNVAPNAPAPAAPRRSFTRTLGIFILGLLVAWWVINQFLVTVVPGERVVLFSLSGGTLQRQLGEGTHFIVPGVQQAIPYDVRTQTYTMSATGWEGEVKGDDSLTALTSDGQSINLDISLRYHPDADRIYQLHQRIGPDYVNKVIRPEVRSKARVVIAQYPISDVYATKREEIQQQMSDLLKQSLAANDIILDELLLRDVQFSTAYAAAIEQKQIAQQISQRKDYELKIAEKEKQKKILEAQGDATSIELRGRAIAQNSRVVQYEYARKLAPNVGAIITDGHNVNVPFSAAAPVAGKR